MRKKIGIRALKNELTDVIRRVKEERAEYTVTVHGRPVAVVRPLTPADAAEYAADDVQQELAEMARLAQEIGASWRTEESAVKTLETMREESAWR